MPDTKCGKFPVGPPNPHKPLSLALQAEPKGKTNSPDPQTHDVLLHQAGETPVQVQGRSQGLSPSSAWTSKLVPNWGLTHWV